MRQWNRNILCLVGIFFFAQLAFVVNSQVVEDPNPVRINTLLVTLPLVVSDAKGRNIAGLSREDFEVEINGSRQEIEFFSNSAEPMSVAIVMDTSGSAKSVLGGIKSAAKKFIETFSSDDTALIMSFDHRVRILAGLTSDKRKLFNAINSAVIADEAGSIMYDALFDVVDQHFSSRQGRKAIIVLTDGVVEGKRVPEEKLRESLIKSDTLVYPVYYQTGPVQQAKTMSMNEFVKLPWVSQLNSIAIITGGRLLVENSDNFESSFQQIADDLKRYYVLGFHPALDDSGQKKNIQVKVKREGVFVRTKGTIRVDSPN